MGIEPTERAVYARPNGFEIRGRHQACKHFPELQKYFREIALQAQILAGLRATCILTRGFSRSDGYKPLAGACWHVLQSELPTHLL